MLLLNQIIDYINNIQNETLRKDTICSKNNLSTTESIAHHNTKRSLWNQIRSINGRDVKDSKKEKIKRSKKSNPMTVERLSILNGIIDNNNHSTHNSNSDSKK